MNQRLLYSWLAMAMRLILGAVFLYAGFMKLQDTQSFADNIDSFELLPASTIDLVALGLPLFEIIVGSLLIIGWQTRTAAFSIMLLLLAFTFGLVQASLRGLIIDCGCFGPETPTAWASWNAGARDFLLLLMAVAVYFRALQPEVLTPAR